jgi:protein associated with RNAse G/E
MKLNEYFEKTKGYCVLSTANSAGRVDAALYSRPFFQDEETVKFIMYDRLTHQNLQSNPFASYLFIETDVAAFKGKRLYLKKYREDSDSAAIDKLFKEKNIDMKYRPLSKFIVYFRIENIRDLVEDWPDHAVP